MNAGNTPGYLLAQIEKALRSAFPSKTKLEMMLQHQFSKNLEDVARGEDLTEIVYKLVQFFQNQNKLEKLIQKALQENSGSSELQNITKKFKIITNLWKILFPLEENYIQKMQQAYRACCPDSFWDDWEGEIPDSLEEIFKKLEEIPQQNYNETPTIQFVARLLTTGEIPERIAHQLKQWGEQFGNNFSELLTKIRNVQISSKEQEIVQTYLIFLLNPSKQHQNKRYLVSAWFIPNGGNDKFNCQTGEGYKILEIEQQEQETFSLEEIPCLLEDYFDQITPQLTDFSSLPTIEIFLPYELLNEPIDTWRIQEEELPIPIGSLYKVILRSSHRLKKYRYRNVWVQKWKTLKELTENACFKCCTSGECHSWQELFSRLNQENAIALRLMEPPSKEFFQVMNQTAIPVALCL